MSQQNISCPWYSFQVLQLHYFECGCFLCFVIGFVFLLLLSLLFHFVFLFETRSHLYTMLT